MTRAFSYGGGVQSTAALVLAARKEIDFPLFIFANVGDDSEHPDTIDYVRSVAIPYAARNGVELVTVHGTRKGVKETLLERLRRDRRSVRIPVRLQPSGAVARRGCTSDFKILPIERELRTRGATKENPWTMGMGISFDELQRMRTDSGSERYRIVYPLVDMRLRREDCVRIIERADMPVPPKSSCWFCPFHTLKTWGDLKRRRPDLFAQAVALEQELSARSVSIGRGNVHMTDRGPLSHAVGDQIEMNLVDDDGGACESGYCLV